MDGYCYTVNNKKGKCVDFWIMDKPTPKEANFIFSIRFSRYVKPKSKPIEMLINDALNQELKSQMPKSEDKQMSKVKKYKQAKAVINDIPNYMEYRPTKEQNEAFDVVLELLNEAIEKATVPCSKCKYYRETDAEWHSGRCLWVDCQTFAEETCDDGEVRKAVQNEQ